MESELILCPNCGMMTAKVIECPRCQSCIEFCIPAGVGTVCAKCESEDD